MVVYKIRSPKAYLCLSGATRTGALVSGMSYQRLLRMCTFPAYVGVEFQELIFIKNWSLKCEIVPNGVK